LAPLGVLTVALAFAYYSYNFLSAILASNFLFILAMAAAI